MFQLKINMVVRITTISNNLDINSIIWREYGLRNLDTI